MLRHRRVRAELLHQPGARRRRVGHRLQRREGLGRDDEQRLRRVQVVCRFAEIGAVDIGDEAEGHRPVAERAQRAIGHLGSQIGPADADIHHVADTLAGMADEGAAAQARRESGHRVEHPVDIRHHIGAVDLDAGAARRAQRDVQYRAAFRGVDLLAGEHRIAAFHHAALFGKLQQQPQRLIGDAVLRVVEEEARAFGREALRPAGIVGEQIAQMDVLDLRVMRRKRLPGRRGGKSGHRYSPRFRPGPCSWRRSPRAARARNRRTPWRRRIAVAAANAVTSMPALACASSATAASPPSRGSRLPVVP